MVVGWVWSTPSGLLVGVQRPAPAEAVGRVKDRDGGRVRLVDAGFAWLADADPRPLIGYCSQHGDRPLPMGELVIASGRPPGWTIGA